MGINNGNERQVSMFIPLPSSHNELSQGYYRITMDAHCLFALEDNTICDGGMCQREDEYIRVDSLPAWFCIQLD